MSKTCINGGSQRWISLELVLDEQITIARPSPLHFIDKGLFYEGVIDNYRNILECSTV